MGAMMPRGNAGRRRRHGGFTEINVTPFVDVMLVLLIIFMVTAPMLTAGVDVDLPDSKAASLPGKDEPLAVSVTKNGDVYIQETQIELDELQPKLHAITGEKTDTRIFVRGDTDVDYGTMMAVVGEINAAGFNKVSLLTDIAQGSSKRR
ncbi:MAG: protein TolR [Rickettsiales bacterium]